MPSEAAPVRSGAQAPRGILLYGMYDLAGLDRAPKVRIAMIARALERRVRTEQITGGRIDRAAAACRWLVSGGPRRVRAVYVEAPTSVMMPTDVAFLLLMRALGRPVGIYFRDAYQLFRDMYPRERRRQIVLDLVWRAGLPLMRRMASVRYVQSNGLGEVLGLRSPVLLPPGTDPGMPDLGAGLEPLVGYVGGNAWADGFDTLVEAMAIVRERVPDARLRVVGPPLPADRQTALPAYVEMLRGGRDDLPELLRPARVCVIPRPIAHYTDVVVPVKLWDYLSMGKPIVSTATAETKAVLEASGAGRVTPDTPEGLADGLLAPLVDLDLARRMASAARAYACSDGATWDARAGTIVESLGAGVKA